MLKNNIPAQIAKSETWAVTAQVKETSYLGLNSPAQVPLFPNWAVTAYNRKITTYDLKISYLDLRHLFAKSRYQKILNLRHLFSELKFIF